MLLVSEGIKEQSGRSIHGIQGNQRAFDCSIDGIQSSNYGNMR